MVTAYAFVYGVWRGGRALLQNRPCFYFCLQKVEAKGTLTRVQTDQDPGETFPQIIARLKDAYGGLSDSEIARRIGMSPAAVSLWVQGKRTPRPAAIRAIHAAFPAIPEADLHAAVGRQAPGPLSVAAEERLLSLFRELTEEQQEIKEIELRAIVEANRKK